MMTFLLFLPFSRCRKPAHPCYDWLVAPFPIEFVDGIDIFQSLRRKVDAWNATLPTEYIKSSTNDDNK